MTYTIRGGYPAYSIWAPGADGLVLLDHIGDFRTVMLWFVSRLEVGDSIVWEAS
jgi:hypothetical protein